MSGGVAADLRLSRGEVGSDPRHKCIFWHYSPQKVVQWNPSIAATVGEWHFGCYTEVAVVEG